MLELKGDMVAVQSTKDRKTEGGIVLPDNSGPELAVVVAVGEGRVLSTGERLKPTVKVGDKLLLKPNQPYFEIGYAGGQLGFINQDAILCVVPDEDVAKLFKSVELPKIDLSKVQ